MVTWVVAGGTTNAYIVEEVEEKEIDRALYTAGIVTHGAACSTPLDKRAMPTLYRNGKPEGVELGKFMQMVPGPEVKNLVFIKGGNAIDPEGNVGVIAANPMGGTIGGAIGPVTAQGWDLIMPVGLEKMVTSVIEGTEVTGQRHMDLTMGHEVVLFPVPNAIVITEIEAIDLLFGIDAVHIASGGVGGLEGAVTLVLEGPEDVVRDAFGFVLNNIKGEPPISGPIGECENCTSECCVYHGLKAEDLPDYMK